MGRTTLITPSTAPAATGDVSDGIRWIYPLGIAATTPLASDPVTIGRDDSCIPPLRSGEVSRAHARLERTATGRRSIADLGSTNGVYVNAEPVAQKELAAGDIIRLGDHIGIVGVFPKEAYLSELESWETRDRVLWCGFELKRIAAMVARLGESTLDGVVLEGEGGTGKGVLAQLFHEADVGGERSGRGDAFVRSANRPFVRVVCVTRGNLPEGLARAKGGTLFLDGVDKLDPHEQSALMRVLGDNDGAVRPAGTRFRFVATTEQPLSLLVSSGKFRRDLLARFGKAMIQVPPLRTYRGDIPALAARFAADAATEAGQHGEVTFEPKFVEYLCVRAWPGNVRELRDLMVAMIAARRSGEQLSRRLEKRIREAVPPRPPSPPPPSPPPPSYGKNMRILFLAANPLTTPALDLEEEQRSLERELTAVRHRERIALIAKYAVRPDDLLVHVRRERPTVVHFCGHGSPDGIVLRNDNGAVHAVRAEALQQFFKDRGVELVFFNSCFSIAQADAVVGAVPTVVGTTSALDDEAARRFSVAFYRTLGDGHSIADAFRDGRDANAMYGFKDVYQSRGDLERVLVAAASAASP
jgi:hypothetical protein